MDKKHCTLLLQKKKKLNGSKKIKVGLRKRGTPDDLIGNVLTYYLGKFKIAYFRVTLRSVLSTLIFNYCQRLP